MVLGLAQKRGNSCRSSQAGGNCDRCFWPDPQSIVIVDSNSHVLHLTLPGPQADELAVINGMQSVVVLIGRMGIFDGSLMFVVFDNFANDLIKKTPAVLDPGKLQQFFLNTGENRT